MRLDKIIAQQSIVNNLVLRVSAFGNLMKEGFHDTTEKTQRTDEILQKDMNTEETGILLPHGIVETLNLTKVANFYLPFQKDYYNTHY